MNNVKFTTRLYGKDHFRHSIDNPVLPEGFIAYHKSNFSKYFGLSEAEFKGKKILETGCGPGKHAVVLALMGAEVTAVDLTPENIERGEKLREYYHSCPKTI